MSHANTGSSTFLRSISLANTCPSLPQEYFPGQSLPDGTSWHQLQLILFHLPCHMCSPSTTSPLSSYFDTQIIFPFSNISLFVFYITSTKVAEGVKYAYFSFEPHWKNQTNFSAFFAYLLLTNRKSPSSMYPLCKSWKAFISSTKIRR